MTSKKASVCIAFNNLAVPLGALQHLHDIGVTPFVAEYCNCRTDCFETVCPA